MKELKKSLLLLTVFFFAALSLTNCRETKEDKAEDVKKRLPQVHPTVTEEHEKLKQCGLFASPDVIASAGA